MEVTLKRKAKIGSFKFEAGKQEVPEWTIDSLRNAGLLIENKPKKEVITKPVKKTTK